MEGLTSREALARLQGELQELGTRCLPASPLSTAASAWLPGSVHSLFRLTSLLAGTLLVTALLGSSASITEVVSAGVILVLVVTSLLLSLWESHLRGREIPRRLERLAELVGVAAEASPWLPPDYPHLDTPPSASLVLQWTHRDGALVSLPWALLVRGDTIVLRPGQSAPAPCSSLQPGPALALAQGEVFQPSPLEKPSPWPYLQPEPQARHFQLLETPCLAELACVLQSAHLRPLSQLNKQRRFLMGSLLEHTAFPLTMVLVLAWNCLRLQLLAATSLSLLPLQLGRGELFPQLFLLEPAAACLPLLPLTLPLWWVITNSMALANVLAVFRQPSLLQPQHAADPFDDTVETPDMEDSTAPSVSWSHSASTALSCLLGTGEFLCRTENLLHCLGSVTSYCCTDSRGLLSWPDTSPERIFFLRQAEEQEGEAATREGHVVPETLTVTHDVNQGLDFDDPGWEQHLASLRPLGLAGLLDTCSLGQEVREGQGRPACVCQLAGLMGLERGQQAEGALLQICSSSRAQLSPGLADSTAMVSLVTRCRGTASLQLLSQGSAELVVECCQDAWTGRDLASLTPALRKKCLEFHHRAALTSYCTAFCYRPLASPPPWPPGHVLRLPPRPPPFLPSWGSEVSVDRVSCSGWEGGQEEGGLKTCLESLHTQSLLGLVQSQYQAMVDMVQFVDLLEKACIRFVHFSKENELRSRVFSEKMGLESGWNCHISLAPGGDLATAAAAMYGRRGLDGVSLEAARQGLGLLRASLPTKLDLGKGEPAAWQQERPLLEGSCSSVTSLEYDMSNRAQLPAGIDAIRPHLEKMDNVPLLVSLFTDCTPASTCQMVEIMQENGEVVAMLGSSANHHNIRSFLAADASLAVEPLYPRVCRGAPPLSTPPSSSPPSSLPPTALAQQIVGVAASVTFGRQEDVSLYQAIIASRRHVLALRQCLHFWVSASLYLALLLLSSTLMTAPLVITPPQVLVLSSFHIPLLATAVFLSFHDTNIRAISTGKNLAVRLSQSSVWSALCSHGLRFLPSLLAGLAAHLLAVLRLCRDLDLQQPEDVERCEASLPPSLALLQGVNMGLASLGLCLASLTFVSSTEHFWRYRPRRSWHILVAVLVLLAGHLLHLLQLGLASLQPSLPAEAWAVLGCSVPLTAAVNELIKRNQIKSNVRFQKRARLEFGTKLGINSPF